MNLRSFPLLTDENIHPWVTAILRGLGFDVLDVKETLGQGRTDREVLEAACNDGRVVVTHDRDFGQLAVAGGEEITGILYLRPGNIDPTFVEKMLHTLLAQDLDLTPPFIIVAERSSNDVRIRVRHWSR